ncbi:MAG: hypothetical protein M1381_05545 [Deltaproteobacteria bacterium]|nr:hypothetical protein [Deltaproteobacteria bacterium]
MKQAWQKFKQEFIINEKTDFFFNTVVFLSFTIIGLIIYNIVFVSHFLPLANPDDAIYIVNNPCIKGISFNHLECIFTHTFTLKYEPLHLSVYMLIYQFFGLNSPMFHVVNLLLHIIDSFLIYLIVLKMMKNKSMAIVSALFFLIAPIQTESIMAMSELKTTLANMFIFSSFTLYMSYRETDKRSTLTIGIILWILGLMSKATAITLPVMFFFYDFLFYPSKLKKAFKWYVGGIIISITSGIVYFLLIYGVKASPMPISNHVQMAIINTAGLFSYPLTQILPLNMLPYYTPLPMFSWLNPMIIISILFILFILFIIWHYRRTLPFISFWLLWYGINIIPGSGIVNVPQFIYNMFLASQGYDHYLLLPFAGLTCIIGYILISLYRLISGKVIYKYIYYLALFTIIISISVITLKFSHLGKDDISCFKGFERAYKEDPVFLANIINTSLINGNAKESKRYLGIMEQDFPYSPFIYYYKGITDVLEKGDNAYAEYLLKQSAYLFQNYKLKTGMSLLYTLTLIRNLPFSDVDIYKLKLKYNDTYAKILCNYTLPGIFSKYFTVEELKTILPPPFLQPIPFSLSIVGCKYLSEGYPKEYACKWFNQALNACYNNTPTNYSFLLKKVVQENCPVLLRE